MMASAAFATWNKGILASNIAFGKCEIPFSALKLLITNMICVVRLRETPQQSASVDSLTKAISVMETMLKMRLSFWVIISSNFT